MKEKNGRFLMIDGIAGSGKTTILNACADALTESGMNVFQLKVWSASHNRPPIYEEVAGHDVLFTFEPTRTWIGAAIREEMSRTDAPYGAAELAHAFALDRQVMYKRLILPALSDGKTIIQDRGVTTSLVYQPIMDDALKRDDVLALAGNRLALDHAPHHLILTRIPPKLVLDRLKNRGEESRGVFADLDMLKRWDERFHANWFRKLMRSNGTKLHEIDTSQPQEKTIQQAIDLILGLIKANT